MYGEVFLQKEEAVNLYRYLQRPRKGRVLEKISFLMGFEHQLSKSAKYRFIAKVEAIGWEKGLNEIEINHNATEFSKQMEGIALKTSLRMTASMLGTLADNEKQARQELDELYMKELKQMQNIQVLGTKGEQLFQQYLIRQIRRKFIRPGQHLTKREHANWLQERQFNDRNSRDSSFCSLFVSKLYHVSEYTMEEYDVVLNKNEMTMANHLIGNYKLPDRALQRLSVLRGYKTPLENSRGFKNKAINRYYSKGFPNCLFDKPRTGRPKTELGKSMGNLIDTAFLRIQQQCRIDGVSMGHITRRELQSKLKKITGREISLSVIQRYYHGEPRLNKGQKCMRYLMQRFPHFYS